MTQQISKETARRILASLDRTGGDIEALVGKGIIAKEAGQEMVRQIDSFADRLQVAAYGQESFEAYKAKVGKVIKKDPDEKYMDTFENVQKPLKTDPDEKYMHHADGGYTSKGIDTYDSDDSSQVQERDEYDVRDLSEWTEKTQKQPSWPGGSSGKSTKQGSEKTWAP